MKVEKIILRDSADTQFDDLITFEEKQLLEDIYSRFFLLYLGENSWLWVSASAFLLLTYLYFLAQADDFFMKMLREALSFLLQKWINRGSEKF